MCEVKEITPDTDYSETKECDYKGEHYLVRDNGAVFRQKKGDRKSKYDNVWLFGYCSKNNYLTICSEFVHRIVATAFLGEPPYPNMVVDHINTNRMDNHPTNLRWLTRLENILNNEITKKKIVSICGSIDNFLKDPSVLYGYESEDKNFSWMRLTTKEESRICTERMKNWAKIEMNQSESKGKLGEWIFREKEQKWIPFSHIEQTETSLAQSELNIQHFLKHSQPYANNTILERTFVDSKSDSKLIITDSITPTALQGDWKTPTEFVRCPTSISNNPLEDYYNNLEANTLFSRTRYGESVILDFALSDDKQHLWVLTENPDQEAVKRWGVAEIVMHDNCFLHLNRHTFFEKVGGRKYFTLEQGKEWTGGDCRDDYC